MFRFARCDIHRPGRSCLFFGAERPLERFSNASGTSKSIREAVGELLFPPPARGLHGVVCLAAVAAESNGDSSRSRNGDIPKELALLESAESYCEKRGSPPSRRIGA